MAAMTDPAPGDPLGWCVPCVGRGMWTRAAALVEGTSMCAPHVRVAVTAPSGLLSGPLSAALRATLS